MKRMVLSIITVFAIIILLSSCGVVIPGSPISFANTRWVAQGFDMFFEVGVSHGVIYGQIIIDGEIKEITVEMDTGMSIHFFILTEDRRIPLFLGSRNWNLFGIRSDMIVTRFDGCAGIIDSFFDEPITQIIFVKEDLTDPTYIVKHPTEGIWKSGELGITIDFNTQISELDCLHHSSFRGTAILDGELMEIICDIVYGTVVIFLVPKDGATIDHQRPTQGGFFRFRSAEEDSGTMTFVADNRSRLYTFIRVE